MTVRWTVAGPVSFSVLLFAAGCSIQVGGTQERRLVTLDGVPQATALKIAQEYATAQQLAELRTAAQRQFPTLGDADLETLTLRYQQMALQSGEHIAIEVTFLPSSSEVKAKAVADFVAEQVRRDIRARLAR